MAYFTPLRLAVLSSFLLLFVLSPQGFGQDASRPFNLFNVRNLRVQFSVPSARPAAMGGAAIALSDDANAATINPAGVGSFSRPAISTTHRFGSVLIPEARTACSDPDEFKDRDRFFDETLVSTVIPFWKVRFSSIRETVYELGYNVQVQQPFEGDFDQPLDELLQRNSPSRSTALNLKIIDNGASLAGQVAGFLNIGASVRLTQLNYSLTESEYFPHMPDSATTCSDLLNENLYLFRTINEKQWGIGFSAGVLLSLHSRVKVGAVFHHRPSFDMSTEIFLPRFAGVFNGEEFEFPSQSPVQDKIRFNLPDTYGIGIAYKYPGRLNIALDVVRVQYSELLDLGQPSEREVLNLVQNDVGAPNNGSGEIDLSLSDHWEMHVGVEYIAKILPNELRTPVRAGFYFQRGALIHATEENPLLQTVYPPEARRHHFTFGCGVLWSQHVRFDGAANISSKRTEITGSAIYTF